MPSNRKRSISLPPELDALVERAASDESTTFSGWLADAARKEFVIRAGLAGVQAFEDEYGALTEHELLEARAWADRVLTEGPKPQSRSRRRSA